MHRLRVLSTVCLLAMLLMLGASQAVEAVSFAQLDACKEFAFSTEEDFVTQGPEPADRNPIISDGDLLSDKGAVCARNADLLAKWEIKKDLGLDAADVLSVSDANKTTFLVAFSTELDAPDGAFQEGDLLVTNGAVIPNLALLSGFQIDHDLGLDAVHFVGTLDGILAFLDFAKEISRDQWLKQDPNLQRQLEEYEIDIWFSTEGSERKAATTQVLDGYLLSARDSLVVLTQAQLFSLTSVPADIPKPADSPTPGIDFGLDAATSTRSVDRPSTRFSTEILYRGKPAFTDGDVLRAETAAIEKVNNVLVAPFEPKATFLGVDALFINIKEINGGTDEKPIFLPNIEKATITGGGAQ